ncbi:MAG TPA: hypothetical protein VE843_00740 [Ktedonobacteraceae bacterium]|nr:hypothetical protein [Ktedonobacteraceae bacterium]
MSSPTKDQAVAKPLITHIALMEETLLHDDGRRHRVMDIAVVTKGAGLGERKTKGTPGRETTRIEGPLVSSNGMGDRIVIRPGHLGAHLHRERRRTEGKVHDRDAIAGAGRCAGGCRRRCIGGRGRRCVRGCCRWCRGRCGRCRTAATGSQKYKQARSKQTQPDFCGEKWIGFLHVSPLLNYYEIDTKERISSPSGGTSQGYALTRPVQVARSI